MLGLIGVAAPQFLHHGPLLEYVISLAMQFWRDSEDAFHSAIGELRQTPGAGDHLIFAAPPFSESNAVFASDPWLFGVTDRLEPKDEVIENWVAQCDLYFRNPFDLAARKQCHRASAGHQIVVVAQHSATAIIAALS